MSLLRFAGRLLYSAYFVQDGYNLLTKPDQNVAQVEATIDRVVPAVQSFLPPDAADRVPEDARTWTRLLGGAQILGGLAYATGIARRPGAILLAAATLPRLVGAATDSSDRSGLLTQLALFGGAVVATQDTAGRPGLAWRAEQSRRAIGDRAAAAGKSVSRTRKSVGKQADQMTKQLGRGLESAKAEVGKATTQAEKSAKRTVRKVRRQVKDVLN